MRFLLLSTLALTFILTGCDAVGPDAAPTTAQVSPPYDITGGQAYWYSDGEAGYSCDAWYQFEGGTATSWSITGDAVLGSTSGTQAQITTTDIGTFDLTANFSGGSLTKRFSVRGTRKQFQCP